MKKPILTLLGLVTTFGLLGWYMGDMPGESARGALPPLSGEERQLAVRLQQHVEVLGRDIGSRSAAAPHKVEEARQYLVGQLRRSGSQVREQEYEARGKRQVNLEVAVPGTRSAREIIVIGAHYDSARGSPGANAGGSGAAALVELARLMTGTAQERTLRFVLFGSGAGTLAGGPDSGAQAYAQACHARGEQIVAMIALDSVGCFDDRAGSQSLPFPLGAFYPSTGDFVGFLGDFGARDLLRTTVGQFRRASGLPSQGLVVPGVLPGLGRGDHGPFRTLGYPAIVVTDTGSWRSPHWNGPSDTNDRVDHERLARLVSGLQRVVVALARRSGPVL